MRRYIPTLLDKEGYNTGLNHSYRKRCCIENINCKASKVIFYCERCDPCSLKVMILPAHLKALLMGLLIAENHLWGDNSWFFFQPFTVCHTFASVLLFNAKMVSCLKTTVIFAALVAFVCCYEPVEVQLDLSQSFKVFTAEEMKQYDGSDVSVIFLKRFCDYHTALFRLVNDIPKKLMCFCDVFLVSC